jgi:CHAT domain-containing protein
MSLYSYSNYFLARGEYDRAKLELEKTATVYEASRRRVGGALEQVMFQRSPYPKLAHASLCLEKNEDAWPAIEKDLGTALAALLDISGGRSLSSEEVAMEDSLKTELGELERELSAYRKAMFEDSSSEVSALAAGARNRLMAVEADWSEFQGEIAARYPLSEGQGFTLERVQKSLSGEEAIIGWFDAEERKGEFVTWGYVIRDSGPVTWARIGRSTGEGFSPSDRMAMLRDNLKRPSMRPIGLNRQLRQLWNERFAPLEGALEGADHLVVIPSGSMLGIPVEAIRDGGDACIVSRFTISYVPSATIHTWLFEGGTGKQDTGGGKTLLIGDPPFGDSELPPLPASREEISAIAEFAPFPKVMLGAEASEEEIVRLVKAGSLAEYECIHIATHALVDDYRPERSALALSQIGLPDPLEAVMSGSRVYDGYISAGEVMRDWDLGADLVSLSACETGLGKKVGGEGYIGFSHAFFRAGARSLIVSLWKVQDDATSLLMQRFYENYFGAYEDGERGGKQGHMPKAEALQEAKSWLMSRTDEYGDRPFEHPFFWSAFILIGDRD